MPGPMNTRPHEYACPRECARHTPKPYSASMKIVKKNSSLDTEDVRVNCLGKESVDHFGSLEFTVKLISEVNKRLVEFVVGLDILGDGTVECEFADVASGDWVLAKVDLSLDKFARFDVLLLSTFVCFAAGSGWGGLDLAGRIGVSWNRESLLSISIANRCCIGPSSSAILRDPVGKGIRGPNVEDLAEIDIIGVGHVGKFSKHVLATCHRIGSGSSGIIRTHSRRALKCVGSISSGTHGTLGKRGGVHGALGRSVFVNNTALPAGSIGRGA